MQPRHRTAFSEGAQEQDCEHKTTKLFLKSDSFVSIKQYNKLKNHSKAEEAGRWHKNLPLWNSFNSGVSINIKTRKKRMSTVNPRCPQKEKNKAKQLNSQQAPAQKLPASLTAHSFLGPNRSRSTLNANPALSPPSSLDKCGLLDTLSHRLSHLISISLRCGHPHRVVVRTAQDKQIETHWQGA